MSSRFITMNRVMPQWSWGVMALCAGTLLGLAILWNPLIAPLGVIGLAAVYIGLRFGSQLPQVFLAALGVLLVGYAFLGRGFAYLGLPPLFVGEMVMALGIVAVLFSKGFWPALRSPIAWLVVVFALWGAVCTLPHIKNYGMDALRDGVLWAYGLFALMVAGFLLHTHGLNRVVRLYGRWLPLLLFWLPVAFLTYRVAQGLIPRVPGSSVPLLVAKPGDGLVHLAGALAFVSMGLHRIGRTEDRPSENWKDVLYWITGVSGFLVLASFNRGGMVAVVLAMMVVIVLNPRSQWWKSVVVGCFLVAAVLAVDIEIDLGHDRKISPQQTLANFQSIWSDPTRAGLQGTKEWRLQWWSDILDYTVYGEHFWLGKGFGVNLADADGYQVGDHTLRSPHSGHLTVLARAGVPGLALWVLLQGAFAVGLLRAYRRAVRSGQHLWANLNVWILAYWTAFMVNSAFDVFLEGPQGGIWFWSVIGVGIAALDMQRRGVSLTDQPAEPVQ